MKKNMKKNLVLGFFSLFIFVFAINFVSANAVSDWLSSTGDKWQAGDIDENLAKWLLFALVFMLIYGVSDKINGLKEKEVIKIPFALVVAFLSMAYITPEEVYAIMSSYSSLGFILSSVIPFFILAFFTFDLAAKEGNANQKIMWRLIAMLMWAGFSIFLVVRIFNDANEAKVLTSAIAIGAIIITLSLSKLMKILELKIHEAVVDKIGMSGDTIAEVQKTRLQEAKALGEE